jgi:4-diphosphocytidyl-2-C-methyl-D-erythritol kinase
VSAVEIEAPAKVNLWLRILARESSGFHSLETLFCAVDLCDSLRVEAAGAGVQLEVEGEVDTGPPEDNLVVKAARAFHTSIGAGEDGVRIRLRKHIPSAAGLGGGSSDAAATLRALNTLHGEPLDLEALLQIGIGLGSDVPFVLGGSALALAWSRGERLLALPPLPAAHLLIAHPGEAMPTAGAFRRISEQRGGEYVPIASRLELGELTSWEAVAARAANDFEPVAVEGVPRIAAGLEVLRTAGARPALLAGSGAAIFGVFPEASTAGEAEQELARLGFRSWRARTLTSLPPVRRA